MSTTKTIAVARVHGNLVDPRFFQSYETITTYAQQRGIRTVPLVIERLHVDRARNEIADMFLHPEKPRLPQTPNGLPEIYKQCSHLLFLDDDMLFPPNTIEKLLSDDVPLVGGLYFARNEPHLPIAYHKVEGNQWVAVTQWKAGLQYVDAVGTGCMLIRRDVLEKMERPYFKFDDVMGEDMFFCEQAKKLGYDVVLDADVKCRHLRLVEVGEEHFMQFREQGLNFQSHQKDLKAISETIKPYKPARSRLETLL